ncbi:MAG: hypothetical protein ABID54_13095 [Pseudomonadota bacterium]
MRFASIQSLVAVVFLILFSSGCFQNRVHEQLLIDLQKEMITVHENNLNTNRKIEEIQKDLSAIENRLQRNNQAIRELERAVLSKVGRGLERGEIEERNG